MLALSSKGAPLTQRNLPEVQDFLARQEKQYEAFISRVAVRTDFGWSGDCRSFVLGREVVGAKARSIVAADHRYLDAFAARGDEQTYLDLCREVRGISPYTEMMWAAGYAGPLLHLLGLRGIVFSCWGSSGGGKSALQSLAASPYGRPEGVKITGDVTPAAIDGVLARSKDLFVYVDDTQLTKNDELLTDLAYQVACGVSRARATQGGKLRESMEWRSLVTISGERPLMKLGAAAGAQNRTVEVEAQPLSSGVAQRIHQTLEHTHGHTGRRYIEMLIERFIQPGQLHDLKRLYERFVRALDENPSDQLPWHVGLLAAADFLARVLLFAEEEGAAQNAAIRAGREVLASARSSRATVRSTADEAYDSVVSWVYEHCEQFGAEMDGPMQRLGIFIEPDRVNGKNVVAILTSAFNALAKKLGFDPQQMCREWAQQGRFVRGEEGRGRRALVSKDARDRLKSTTPMLLACP